MKTIEERAKEWGEHIVETTPYDVVNGKACVFVEDRNIADVAEESYIAGATEQKEIDEEVRLKKCDDMTKEEYDREEAFTLWYAKKGKSTPTFSDAIEWARKETIDKACKWLRIATQCGVYPCSGNGFVEDFRKAMELKDNKDNDDEVNEGQALLYAVNKTEERVKRKMIKKACKWLCESCPAQLDEENDFSGCEGNRDSHCPTMESLINAMEE